MLQLLWSSTVDREFQRAGDRNSLGFGQSCRLEDKLLFIENPHQARKSFCEKGEFSVDFLAKMDRLRVWAGG